MSRAMVRLHLASFAMLPLLASCVAPRSAPPAAPAPAPAPAPQQQPSRPVIDRFTGDWSVADATPGEWTYQRGTRGSDALFGAATGAPLATIACRDGAIRIGRAGVNPVGERGRMNLRTSFAERALPVSNDLNARMVVAVVEARDPLLDQILYSRGRFVIETSQQQPLILPTRPEIARVVEDCRS